MFIPNKIKELREKKGVTQPKMVLELFAQYQLEVTRQTITSWENGDTFPGANILNILCKYFDVSADVFYNKL